MPAIEAVFDPAAGTLRRIVLLPTGMAITFGCSRPVETPPEPDDAPEMDEAREMDEDGPEMV